MMMASSSTALKLLCNAGLVKFDSARLNLVAIVDCSRQKSLNVIKTRAIDPEGVQNANQVELGIMCEPCGGTGWLICDFCKGKKTNVKADNKRIYRRCPSCRAVGYLLCSKCKVFKCVTFPDASDGVDLML